jgi:oligopeptide transport system substrate-binding protein
MQRTRNFLLIASLTFGLALSAEAVTLQRGNGPEPQSLDVHKSSGVPEANLQVDLYEGLVHYGPKGEPVPGVAERWEISPDGLVYTFHLRGNAKWSNGDPVTAKDFVYSYRRAVDPATASKYAFILYPIRNAETINKGELKDLTQLGVTGRDGDRTLVITLKAPTPYFLGMLVHHMAFPVHQATVEKHGDRWTRPGNMVTNGAYMLAEWTPQSHIKLLKNPHYWDAKAAQIDEVIYHVTEDRAAELKRFRAGELDIAYEAPSDQVPWMKENLKGEFRPTPYLGTYYYAFNLTTPPFKANPKLRQALALAIDRDAIVNKISLAGEVPAYSWVAPGVGNEYPGQAASWAKMSQAERNELAKKLYAEAGFGPGKPLDLEILYNTNENHRRIAIGIAGMWKELLGVNASLRNEEWKVYLESRDEKKFQVIRQGWIGDYNDANTFLELMKSDIGKQNSPGYDSRVYDHAMREAEVTVDLKKRAALMQQAEAILLDDLPIIPIFHYVSKRSVKSHVKGWVDNVMDHHPTRYLSIVR